MAGKGKTAERLERTRRLLAEESDPSHRLTLKMIQSRLQQSGFDAVKCSTVSKDIEKLRESGVEIAEEHSGRTRELYMVKELEFTDLKILCELVRSSGFLSEGRTGELIGKLRALGTQEDRDRLDATRLLFNASKRSSHGTLYSLDAAEEAAAEGKQLSFEYYDDICSSEALPHYDPIKTVSPVGAFTDEGRLYLYAWDASARNESTGQPGAFRSYRFDKMQKAVKLETPAAAEALHLRGQDLSAVLKSSFRMFLSGEEKPVTLRFPKRLTGHLRDKFGEDIPVEELGGDLRRVTVPVRISGNFYGWLVQFGGEILPEGPEDVVEGFQKHLQGILGKLGK